MWSAWKCEYTRWVTLDGVPASAVTWSDGSQQVVADGRRCVHDDDALGAGEEHGLVEAVGDPVQVVVDLAHEVAIGVQRRTEGARAARALRRQVTRRPTRCPAKSFGPAMAAAVGTAAIMAARPRNPRRLDVLAARRDPCS